MKRLVRWLIFLGILGGIVAGIGYWGKSWLEKRSIPTFQTAKVTRGRIETVVNSSGTIKPVLSVSVGAFTSGPIAKVNVDFNSVVKKDDILATIDSRLLEAAVEHDRAAVDSQKADLARVQALLQQSINNEKRARQLLAINKDYLAETDLDQYYFTRLSYEAQIKLSEAAIKQAEATLKNSLANLGYTKIVAPVDGIVIERKVDPGQTVAASFQTPELFILAPDMDKHMFVYASVDEADIGQIANAQQRGQLVKFTVDAYPGDLFEGKIHQIRKNSTTTQNVVTYPVVIEAANKGMKLLPGMTANITFQIETKEDVLRVPAAALRYTPLPSLVRPEDKHYLDAQPAPPAEGASTKTTANDKARQSKNRHQRIVWVKDGEKLRAVPITLGLIVNQFAEYLDGGLAEDQELVTGAEFGVPPR